MWYNTTTGTLRGIAVTEGWSSGGPLSTGRYLSGSLGTQTAGVQIIGSTPTNVSNVEHYNGTGWSEETNYPAAGQAVSGAGTQTAGIAFGGSTPSQTANAFSYNGTAWTVANSLPYTANNIASCGLAKTSVIGAVGRDGSSGNSGTNKSITFDGTNFANGPNINTTRMFNNSSGAGTGTAALIVGGFIDPSPNAMTNCEEYNGVAWTATGALNVATGFASAFGIQTNAVAQTNGSNYVETEAYNGSTWSTLPNMSVSSPGGLYGSSAGSTGDAGWVSSIGPAYNATEEFNRSTNTITAGAWASGGSLNTGRYFLGGCGLQTAALAFGGTTPVKANTETYDGTSWAEVNDLGTAREEMGSAGTQTAALAIGGQPGSGSTTANEEWDGTNWTAGGALPAGKKGSGGAGTQTAALNSGGVDGPGSAVTTSEEYNGSSWTAGGALPAAKYNFGSSGTQTAGLAFGGSEDKWTTTEEYNGSSWTTGGAMNKGAKGLGASTNGTQTASIGFSGRNPNLTAITNTEGYDGTSWSTRPNVATAKQYIGGAGTSTAALKTGGGPSPGSYDGVEEFTGETTAGNITDFTTS